MSLSLTFYLQAGYYSFSDFIAGLAMGLMAANLLIVNNYRDYEDDASSGKLTTAVVFGRRAVLWAYLVDGLLAAAVTVGVPGLNPALGMTAMLMFLFSLSFLLVNL